MATKKRATGWARTSAALIAAGVLALAGCSSPATEGSGGSTGDPAADECGTIPDLGATDPGNLLADFSEDTQAAFNAYPLAVEESAWVDWKSSKTEGWTAAYVGHPPGNPFIATLQENLIADLEDEGIEVIANLAPDVVSNVPLQIQQLQEAIALKPDIIFFLPSAPEAAVETIKSAYDAGIPVVTVQLPVDSPYAVNVSMNGVLQSMITGSGVLKGIGGEGDVLRVTGIPGIGSTIDANTGFENVLEFCPGVTVVGEVAGMFNPATTQAEVLKYLATNPAGVDAVLQDGTMGLSTFTAFQESGIDPMPPINDTGGSQGFASWALENPDYPYFGSTTSPSQQAAATVSVGKRILAGGGPKLNQVVYAPVIVDRENLAEIADPSAEITDPTALENPPDTLLPEAQLVEFFTDPSAGE